MKRHLPKILSIILITFLAGILLYESWHDAGTYDEVGHITAGYSYVYLGDFRLYPDNPPLIKMLAVLPWWPIRDQIKFPLTAPEYTQTEAIDWWKLGTKFLYQSGNDADKLIFLARLPIIGLTLALGLLVAKFASDLYGRRAGLFALFLYTLEPNVRAHGHLVTADLGSTFFVILSLYFLYKALIGSDLKGAKGLTLAGMTFGLAILSKYSMLFFLPILGILLFLETLRQNQSLKLCAFRFALFAFISYLTLWLLTLAVGYSRITFRYEEVGLNKSAKKELGDRLVWKAFHMIPLPYYYTVGLEQMYARNFRGQPSFLFGTVNPSGNWWQYFLVTYLVKTPIPTLLFVSIAFITAIKRIKNKESRIMGGKQDHYSLLHDSYFMLPLFAGLLFFITISLNGNLSIGLRFVFPSVILFLIFASSVIAISRLTKKTLIVFAALLIWLIITNLTSLPYDISYVNELGGGTWEGYKTVSDSSYDWGQDLKRLAAWVRKNASNQTITLSYLGTADPTYYGIQYKQLRFEDLDSLRGFVAISATNLMLGGRYGKDQTGKVIYDPSPLRVFTTRQPLARAGTTIFIYQFP